MFKATDVDTLADSISTAIEDALESSSGSSSSSSGGDAVVQEAAGGSSSGSTALLSLLAMTAGCVCFECTSPHSLSAGKLLLCWN